jgi:hypothetical protein
VQKLAGKIMRLKCVMGARNFDGVFAKAEGKVRIARSKSRSVNGIGGTGDWKQQPVTHQAGGAFD